MGRVLPGKGRGTKLLVKIETEMFKGETTDIHTCVMNLWYILVMVDFILYFKKNRNQHVSFFLSLFLSHIWRWRLRGLSHFHGNYLKWVWDGIVTEGGATAVFSLNFLKSLLCGNWFASLLPNPAVQPPQLLRRFVQPPNERTKSKIKEKAQSKIRIKTK